MAGFSYVPTGGVRISGCATAIRIPNYAHKWPLGTRLYALYKARRGCLEAVVLKQVRVVQNMKTGALTYIMYVDTLNGLWDEDELVELADAQAAVDDYNARREGYLAACLRNCTC